MMSLSLWIHVLALFQATLAMAFFPATFAMALSRVPTGVPRPASVVHFCLHAHRFFELKKGCRIRVTCLLQVGVFVCVHVLKARDA